MKLKQATAMTNEELTNPRALRLAKKAIEKTGRMASVEKIYNQIISDLKHPENITRNPELVMQYKSAIRHLKHNAKRNW